MADTPAGTTGQYASQIQHFRGTTIAIPRRKLQPRCHGVQRNHVRGVTGRTEMLHGITVRVSTSPGISEW